MDKQRFTEIDTKELIDESCANDPELKREYERLRPQFEAENAIIEAQIRAKKEGWDFAIGMSKVDGGEPSKELLELVEKEIRGEITMEDIKKALYEKYSKAGDHGAGE